MDDARIWAFEESLWTADADHYRASIDPACLMALPAPPHVLDAAAAVAAVSATPRWEHVRFSQRVVSRPEEGLIVIAYQVRAEKADANAYEAFCTSTYKRRGHADWTVIQHSQTPPLTIGAGAQT